MDSLSYSYLCLTSSKWKEKKLLSWNWLYNHFSCNIVEICSRHKAQFYLQNDSSPNRTIQPHVFTFPWGRLVVKVLCGNHTSHESAPQGKINKNRFRRHSLNREGGWQFAKRSYVFDFLKLQYGRPVKFLYPLCLDNRLLYFSSQASLWCVTLCSNSHVRIYFSQSWAVKRFKPNSPFCWITGYGIVGNAQPVPAQSHCCFLLELGYSCNCQPNQFPWRISTDSSVRKYLLFDLYTLIFRL